MKSYRQKNCLTKMVRERLRAWDFSKRISGCPWTLSTAVLSQTNENHRLETTCHWYFYSTIEAQDMTEFAKFAKDLIVENPDNFRSWPRWNQIKPMAGNFQVTNRQWMETQNQNTMNDCPLVGIDSQLSEHQCEGFLEGYVLTGRHGFFCII